VEKPADSSQLPLAFSVVKIDSISHRSLCFAFARSLRLLLAATNLSVSVPNIIKFTIKLNACINFGEVGHIFSECTKPWLLESAVDFVVTMPRSHIAGMPFAIVESW